MSVANLFDTVHERFDMKSDRAMANALGIQASIVSKMRNEHLPLNDTTVLRMVERLNMDVLEIRALAA